MRETYRSRFSATSHYRPASLPERGLGDEAGNGKAEIYVHAAPCLRDDAGLRLQELGTSQLFVFSVVDNVHINDGISVMIKPRLAVNLVALTSLKWTLNARSAMFRICSLFILSLL